MDPAARRSAYAASYAAVTSVSSSLGGAVVSGLVTGGDTDVVDVAAWAVVVVVSMPAVVVGATDVVGPAVTGVGSALESSEQPAVRSVAARAAATTDR